MHSNSINIIFKHLNNYRFSAQFVCFILKKYRNQHFISRRQQQSCCYHCSCEQSHEDEANTKKLSYTNRMYNKKKCMKNLYSTAAIYNHFSIIPIVRYSLTFYFVAFFNLKFLLRSFHSHYKHILRIMHNNSKRTEKICMGKKYFSGFFQLFFFSFLLSFISICHK